MNGAVRLCATMVAVGWTVCSSVAVAEESEAKPLPQWRDYMEALAPIGDRIVPLTPDPQNEQARQETYRIMMATLAQGYIAHVYADPSYPEFISLYNPALNLAAPVPDYMYNWTPINSAGIYRLKGYRGTNRFVDLTLGQGFYALGTSGPALDVLSLDDVKLSSDGSFEIIVSAERPKGYERHWWKLPPKARSILLRQASYDWLRERDALVTIERMDVPAQRPALSAAELSQRLSNLATWVERGTVLWYKRLKDIEQRGLTNKLGVYSTLDQGANPNQVQVKGLYRLTKDEALIVETELPSSCRYWSILVSDEHVATVDWVNRQSSLNGHQARIDADGKFRAVVASSDPGVPNWLDTGGSTFGELQVRWNKCNAAPVPTTKKVRLSELRNHLPAETPTVSAQERDKGLRLRREGAQLRRRW